MSPQTFDRDTWLDLTVNIVPLGILAFFFAVYVFVQPFGNDGVFVSMQLGIIATTFVFLAIVTYYAGRAITNAEESTSE